MLVYIIIFGLIVAVAILAYRLYMTKSYYKYDKDRLNKVEEEFAKKQTDSNEALEKLQKIASPQQKNRIFRSFPVKEEENEGFFALFRIRTAFFSGFGEN